MEYRIFGEIAQYVEMIVQPHESIWASKGCIMSMTRDISWQLKIPGGAKGAVRRTLSGEGIALTYITAGKKDQQLRLASNNPGHIEAWNLADGAIITTRGSFLAAWGDQIDISVAVAKRVGAAFFGGAGLFLQRISGQGIVLISGQGDFCKHNLAENETIVVSTGNLAAFSDSIDYNIQGVSGCRRILFGGEGIFMTHLTGPGNIMLQSLKPLVKNRSGQR